MWEIIIDRNKCEGKAKCLEVCPEDVFVLSEPDPKELNWHGRFKLRFHGGKQAFAARPEDCSGCCVCIDACPGGAISVREMKAVSGASANPGSKLPKSPFPYWMAFVLVGPLRRFLFNPRKIIDDSGIKEGQTVLEIGCGPGFFTEFISEKIGRRGRLIAQDVQPQMLAKLEKRMARFPVKENIELMLANSSKLNLASESVDYIFAANVFEEIAKEGELKRTANELYRVLKPNCLLLFGEHRVPPGVINNIRSEIERAGFRDTGEKITGFFHSAIYRKS